MSARWIFTLALAACAPPPAPRARPAMAAAAVDTSSIGVTWIGHATVLLRIHDKWILTDPVLGDRIARVLPRNVAAGMDARDLPPLDAVVISHAHFDHLDVRSLERLDARAVLVPPGAAKFIPPKLRDRVSPRATWESWTSPDGLTITAVPAKHGDGRYVVDFWTRDSHAGFVINYRGLTVYFAGDTGYSARDAAALRERFAIDVALIPVGPGRAKWIEDWRADAHVTPEVAMQLFRDTGAQWMVPIHFGTFFKQLRDELPRVERAVRSAGLERRVRILGIGDTTEFLY